MYPRSGFGYCSYEIGEFNRLGRFLGPTGSTAWISFAGPAVDSLRTSALLSLGIYLALSPNNSQNSYCTKTIIGANLIVFSMLDYHNSMKYHLSHFALSRECFEKHYYNAPWHDMISVAVEVSKRTGLHPVIPSVSSRALVSLAPLILAFSTLRLVSRKDTNEDDL